jgi:hypothetical protein
MSDNGDRKNPREMKIEGGKTLIINLNRFSVGAVLDYINTVVPPYESAPVEAKDKEQAAYEERQTKRAAVLRQVAEFRGKCCGLTADEVQALGYEDYVLLGKKITDLILDPVGADPN